MSCSFVGISIVLFLLSGLGLVSSAAVLGRMLFIRFVFFLFFVFCFFFFIDFVWLGVIAQDGQSSTCAQSYYHITPQDCSCTFVGCPASSKGSDPQVNEFATNSVATKAENGNYVYIDMYWSYIQQLNPDGTQVNPPSKMVQQYCMASNKKDIYRVVALEYDLSLNKLYGIAQVPNNLAQTYDAKVVEINMSTGECIDVVGGIPGTASKWPTSCCGAMNQPTFDQTNKIFYFYGPAGYNATKSKLPTSYPYTIVAANIMTNTYTVGFVSDRIYPEHGFLFHDPQLGLFALGWDEKKVFGLYQLITDGWKENFEVIEDRLVMNLGKPLPNAAAYEPTQQKLYLMFDSVAPVVTVDMKTLTYTQCNLPKECLGKLWTFPIVLTT